MRYEEKKVEFDLVVVGGGVPGVCCAVQAALEGLNVALINDRADAETRLTVRVYEPMKPYNYGPDILLREARMPVPQGDHELCVPLQLAAGKYYLIRLDAEDGLSLGFAKACPTCGCQTPAISGRSWTCRTVSCICRRTASSASGGRASRETHFRQRAKGGLKEQGHTVSK